MTILQGSGGNLHIVDDYSGMPIEELQKIVMDTFTLVAKDDFDKIIEEFVEARNHEIRRDNL